jgi:hypothetical protein
MGGLNFQVKVSVEDGLGFSLFGNMSLGKRPAIAAKQSCPGAKRNKDVCNPRFNPNINELLYILCVE